MYVPYCAGQQAKYGACYPDEARFTAGPGELNRVTITRAADAATYQQRVSITDTGAPLQAGPGCTQVDANTATCAGYNILAIVALGDGDDTADGPGSLSGGAGNDTLKGTYILDGGPGDDTLEGGDQNERLIGGPGHDTLSGGPGNDLLEPDAGAADGTDIVDGGDGTDTVSYLSRKTGVTVSLQQPLSGEDRLSAIESVQGGDGNDVLTGDAGPNTLAGGPGNDTLTGGDGRDVVDGQAGSDTIDGGDGNDLLSAGDDKTAHNEIRCGDGADRASPSPATTVADDCEIVAAPDLELVGRVRQRLPLRGLRAPVVSIGRLACLERPCRLTMTIRIASGQDKGRLIGAALRRERGGGPALPKTVALGLNGPGRRLLGSTGAGVTARITIAFRDGGELSLATWLVVLARS